MPTPGDRQAALSTVVGDTDTCSDDAGSVLDRRDLSEKSWRCQSAAAVGRRSARSAHAIQTSHATACCRAGACARAESQRSPAPRRRELSRTEVKAGRRRRGRGRPPPAGAAPTSPPDPWPHRGVAPSRSEGPAASSPAVAPFRAGAPKKCTVPAHRPRLKQVKGARASPDPEPDGDGVYRARRLPRMVPYLAVQSELRPLLCELMGATLRWCRENAHHRGPIAISM